MSDAEANAFYADPENRVPAGEGRRRARPAMSSHVPVRFPAEVIAEVKYVASEDHKTVSSWIRDVVERELKRRRPQYPQTGSYADERDHGIEIHGWEALGGENRTAYQRELQDA